MNTIKCSCGYEGCSTQVFIREGVSSIDLVLEWKEKDLNREQSIALDPNKIVQLIKELKQSLSRIA